MIRVAITPTAYEAIAGTSPLGSVGYENKVNERGGARAQKCANDVPIVLRQGAQIWT
jgi:hypothetical protein